MPNQQQIAAAERSYQEGEAHYRNKNYTDALASYGEAMMLNHNHLGAIFSLGWLYEHDQGCGLRWRLNDEGDYLMRLVAGRYYFVKPTPVANGTFEIDSKHRMYRDHVALVYYKAAADLGHYQALKRYLRLTKKNVDNADTWFRWGKEYDKEKNYAHARASFERTLELNSKHVMAHQWLGMMYENGNGVTQDYAEAKRWYTKYYELSNDKLELQRLERKIAEKNANQQNVQLAVAPPVAPPVLEPTFIEDITDTARLNTAPPVLALTSLVLSRDSMQYLALCLKRNTTIEELSLSGRTIDPLAGVAFAELLTQTTTLKTLRLNVGMDSATCAVIGRALALNQSIRELDLSSNQLNDSALDELITGLQSNRTLERLNLKNNLITAVGVNALQQQINSGIFKTGLRIDLRGNQQFTELSVTTATTHVVPVVASNAINSMGVFLYNQPNATERHYQSAARFFDQANGLGNAYGTYNLALIYQYGKTGSVNMERAAYYIAVAQSRGYVFPPNYPVAPQNHYKTALENLTYALDQEANACKAIYQGREGVARLVSPAVGRLLGIDNMLQHARQYNYKYYGHAQNLEGNINQQELTGFSVSGLFPLHIFYLFQMLVMCRNERVSDYLKNELRIAIEIYQIDRFIKDNYQATQADNLFFAIAIHYFLPKLRALPNQSEYAIAVRFDINREDNEPSGHALYVNFVKRGENIIIRVDNLGYDGSQTRYHQAGAVGKPWINRELVTTNNADEMINNHRWPIVVGCFNLESQLDALISYLMDLCRANYLNYDVALPLIYTKRFRHTTDSEEGFHRWFSTRKLQDKGNCVYDGFSVGADIRSQPYDPAYSESIGNVGYEYATHQNPKQGNPKKGLYRDIKRLTIYAAQDKLHQEVPVNAPEARRRFMP